jgi:hypothetical protein
MGDPRRDVLLALVDEAFDRKAWHGPNLRGTVRGVTARVAAKRPAAGRHNVWELVVHAAYWKYAVRRRLTGEKRGSFALPGSNWFPCPSPLGERAWKDAVALLVREHRRLRAVIVAVPARSLPRASKGSRYTNARMIAGIAAHDLYHAGQIQVVKRLVS